MKQLLLLAALPGALLAQALEGTWQGALSPPNQSREIRVVLKITKNENVHQGTLYNIDQGGVVNLAQLLTFAFGIHRKQVSGLPGWAETDHFDIEAPIPGEGAPNDVQLRTMIQNLIKSRFGLAYHQEKRELSVYAVNVGKGGPAG